MCPTEPRKDPSEIQQADSSAAETQVPKWQRIQRLSFAPLCGLPRAFRLLNEENVYVAPKICEKLDVPVRLAPVLVQQCEYKAISSFFSRHSRVCVLV